MAPKTLFYLLRNARIVAAIFLKETLANAANDAELQLTESKRLSQQYQNKLEAAAPQALNPKP